MIIINVTWMDQRKEKNKRNLYAETISFDVLNVCHHYKNNEFLKKIFPYFHNVIENYVSKLLSECEIQKNNESLILSKEKSNIRFYLITRLFFHKCHKFCPILWRIFFFDIYLTWWFSFLCEFFFAYLLLL